MEEQNKNLFQEGTEESQKETSGGGKAWGYVLATILVILVILAIIFFASPKSRIPAPTTQTGQVVSSQVTTSSQATETGAEAGTAAPSSLCKTIKSIESASPALIITAPTGADEYEFFVHYFNQRTQTLEGLAIPPQRVTTLELFTIDGIQKYGYKITEDFALGNGVYAWAVSADGGNPSETYECFRIGEDGVVGPEGDIDLADFTGTTLIAQNTAGNFWGWLIGISTSWFEVGEENVLGLAQKAQGNAAIEDIRDRCGDADGSILVALTPEGLTCNDLSGTGWRSI